MRLKSGRIAVVGDDLDFGRAPQDLTAAVMSGVLWKIGTRIVAEVTRLAVVVVLAHLLTPTDYGIAGMAFVAASFASLFTDPALGAALIQRPAIDERDRSTVFYLAVGVGVLLTLIGVAVSGTVADFFGEEQVRPLFAVMAVCFFVISLSVVHRALLLRQLAYRSLEIREMISIVSAAVVAVSVAAMGFGPWAIISNFVAYSTMSTVLAWLLLDWRPRARFSIESARAVGGFSAKVFSSRLLSWGDQNLDNTLVGRFLGAPALGVYALAYNGMQLPSRAISMTLHQALSPAYSRIQHDRARLERAWLRSKRISVALMAPALLGLIVVAPDFVRVAFGSKWHAVVVPLQLLCAGSLAVSLEGLNWALLQARGEGGTLLRLSLLTSAVTWGAFAIGLAWGVVGVAACYAIARWALVVPTTFLTTRRVSFGLWPTLRAGGELLPIAAAAAAAALGVRELALDDAGSSIRLVATAVTMTAAYVTLVWVLTPSLVREMATVVRGRWTRANRFATGREDRLPDVPSEPVS